MKRTWSPEEIQNLIEQTIRKYNTQRGGTVSSFSVPLHKHNGSDSPQIIMGDLRYDVRGLNFPNSQGETTFVVDTETVPQSFVIKSTPDNTATTSGLDFVVGVAGASFHDVSTNSERVFLTAQDPSSLEIDTFTVQPTFAAFTASIALSGVTGWFLRLPDNLTLPPSPQVGDICIYGGLLQVCETAGIWTAK